MTFEQAEKKIRHAWIAGLISGFMTLIFTIMAATQERGTLAPQGSLFSAWSLLDVFLIFLLTFGIYVKSRVAAIGMFIYFLASKIIMWVAAPAIGSAMLVGILLGIVFLYFYFEGARGAIAYHQLRQSHIPANLPVASPED